MSIYLKRLRNLKNKSQSDMSDMLDISRSTYVQIEKGERILSIDEAKKVANYLGVSILDLINEKIPDEEIKEIKSNSLFDKDKFKETFIYLISKIGAQPNIGQTAIYKILYFIDFDFFEIFNRPLTGATYICNKYGPTPREFIKTITELISEDAIEEVSSKYFNKDQKKYIPLREANLNILTSEELRHIDTTIDRLKHLTASELSSLSHNDIPWKLHAIGEDIKYTDVYKR